MTELVPSCHSTRSGLAAITAESNRASMSATSSPPTPRLSTVIDNFGKCSMKLDLKPTWIAPCGRLAPAPAVDDEPMATMVTGAPKVSFFAMCGSGLASRIRSSGVSQVGRLQFRRAPAVAKPTPQTARRRPPISLPVVRDFRSDKVRILHQSITAAVDRRLFRFGGRNNEIGQQPAYAIMNLLRNVKFFRGRIQIERPEVRPKIS